jgi:hypothetical protein
MLAATLHAGCDRGLGREWGRFGKQLCHLGGAPNRTERRELMVRQSWTVLPAPSCARPTTVRATAASKGAPSSHHAVAAAFAESIAAGKSCFNRCSRAVASAALAANPELAYRTAVWRRRSAALAAVSASPHAAAISDCASNKGTRRRSPNGGRSFHGSSGGLRTASAIKVAAAARSPCSIRSSAIPGSGGQARRWACRNASSAPSRSPRRSRILPSSTSGQPNSRRIHGRSSSQAASAQPRP